MNENNYSMVRSNGDIVTIHTIILEQVEQYIDYNDSRFDDVYFEICDIVGVQEEGKYVVDF